MCNTQNATQSVDLNSSVESKKSDVILHAFDWPYQLIADRAQAINDLGYKTVLVSPPMKSKKHENGTPWWQRYQPQDYRVIDNQLGDTESFVSMVNTLKTLNLRVYVDVVFNHMANESKERRDLNYPNKNDLRTYKNKQAYYQKQTLFGDLSEPLFTEGDFVEAFGITDWKDRWEVQNGRISGGPSDPGLPTLDANKHVVEQQRHYIKALKAIGVKGFRIDAAKHMTLEHLKQVWTKDITDGVHIFGEIITDGGATAEEYDLFLEPYLKATDLGAYDFPLFNVIFDAFSVSGSLVSLINPYCFGQALSNRRAITFAITHDIPNNDVFSNLVMDEEDEWLAYAYILGRDGGVPLIYTDLDTSGILDKLKQPRWKNSWKSERMASMIQFHNLVHGRKMKAVDTSKTTLVFAREQDGAVAINKGKAEVTIELPWEGDLWDCIANQWHKSVDGVIRIKLASKSCVMMVSQQVLAST